REIDSTVVLVEAWGSWIAGTAPLCDEDGRIVGAISADLPADVDVHLDTARGNLSETFSALVHSAALRLNRAEVDAITDGLTGVYNHRYLHERLAQEVEGADERQSTLTLLFCDIDRFKLFNDRHGHSVGDAALHGVAQIVESSIRHVDVAARYGGEEFAVILIDTGPEAGHRIAERIRRRIAQTSFGDDGRLTISIGLATYPDDADTPERLIERADAAMYEAKRLGRDRVATCAAGAVSAEASPPAGDDGCAGGAAAARRLTEARDSYERSRADLLSWVAGEVALRLGLSDEAAGEVARQTRDRVRAGRRARGRAPAVPPAARRQVTSDLAERIAAAVLLCERPIQRDGAGPAADDRERLVSTLRRDTRGRADQVVLEALADVLMAHPAPAETTDS
ncbi:MAG TPA: GGDEF domain-containing protein, partial [Thermoleophilia bacterium]|nr:GGDEF domain-containing protein [Thermoleophilia bacterium]